MSGIKQSQIPVLLTLLVGLIIFADYYFKIQSISDAAGFFKNAALVIATIAIILGAINIISIHGNRMMKQTKGQWFYSLCLLVSMSIMVVTGLMPPFATHPIYTWFYDNVMARVGQAVYAVLAFYMASAGFRAFRARSWEATILLISGFIMLLSSAPVGSVILPQITPIGEWFMSVPNMAAQRGLILAIATGAITLGIRVYLGRERLGGPA